MLHIKVLVPPWKTWWAWCIYILFVGGVAYLILNYYLSKIKMQNEINMKQLEKQTIEQGHQMRITLFTNFSHELRTPLTLILDPLKNILSDGELPTKFSTPLNRIQENAEKILLLVNQLMDLHKSEAGKMSTRMREGDIVEFIDKTAVIFRELASPHNIQIQTQSSHEKIVFHFDPFLMEKVFFNILSNAIKNTPDNGSININIDIISQSTRLHHDNEDISYLYIVIRDTGVGIQEENIERVFEPFFQVSEQNREGSHGTGIGLHLTKSIITLHHGAIWAESIPGNGTSFHIELPLDESLYSEAEFMDRETVETEVSDHTATAEIIASEILPEDAKKQSKPKVLVVDDNIDIRLYIRDILRAEYKIYEAENGEEALNIAQSIIPDLIICDIMMPVKDGLELTHELKSNVETSHIPIILLTAKSTVDQIKEGLGAGRMIILPNLFIRIYSKQK